MDNALKTLADCIENPRPLRTSRDCLTGIVRSKAASGEELFPDIFGLDHEKRRCLEILAGGRGVLLTGEYGVAKTDLARHIVDLLNELFVREPLLYVERCPVQEDPALLVDYIVKGEGCGVLPCPICRKMIADAEGDYTTIGVGTRHHLVEGAGFSRVQGGGDVLPEEIIGTYNLLKLSEIGDPFDPRVFEPGKIGQASRGVLFVDEIGKLPETAQHALIQAAQEYIVTPSKSRETFPVDFLLVATTNPVDEEYICGAVRDRLVSLSIPLVSFDDELHIVRKELGRIQPAVYLPELYLSLAVATVRALRSDERLELGPRASINAAFIARSSALFEGRSMVSFCNIKEGIFTAILGKALYEDKQDVERAVQDAFPSIGPYLQKHIEGVDLERILRKYCGDGEVNAQTLKEHIAGSDNDELSRFAGWAYHNETIHKFRMYEVLAEYLSAYHRGCPSGELHGRP